MNAGLTFWGHLPSSVLCANMSEGCLSFLCASLSTKIQPKIKGSFLSHCTSASLRAATIARTGQVLRRLWSRNELLWNSVFRNVFNYKIDHLHLLCCPREAAEGVVGEGGMTREGQASEYQHPL